MESILPLVRTEHCTTLHWTSADILFLSPSFNTEEEEVRESPTKALAVAAQECKMAAVSDTVHTHTSTATASLPLGLAWQCLTLLLSWVLSVGSKASATVLETWRSELSLLFYFTNSNSHFTKDINIHWRTLTPCCLDTTATENWLYCSVCTNSSDIDWRWRQLKYR